MTPLEINCAITRAIDSTVSLAGESYREQFGDDSSHQREFCRKLAERLAAKIGCVVVDHEKLKGDIAKTQRGPQPAPKIVTPGVVKVVTAPPPSPLDGSIAGRAIALADEIEDLASSGELPSRAFDFAESVAGKAASIRETVEERGTATDAQIEALENMLSGLERWIR